MPDIVGIDMPCLDLNVNVDNFPRPNRGERVQKLSWQGGGKVSSGMVAAARLGATCAMMGAVGDDLYGRFCTNDFNRHGINTSAMCIRKGDTTSLSVVLSDRETGGRSIVFHPGTAARATFEEFDPAMIAGAKYLFIAQANETTERAVDVARAAGVQVLVDADGYSEDMVALIPKIDVFIGSEFFYQKMYGDDRYEANVREVMAKGPKIAVFTLGENGCVGVSAQGFFQLPAFRVDVVDTVGAGDVYHGAFAAGLLSGRSVEETARFASAVSAIKCTRIGGRAGIPNLATVERFLLDGTIDYTEIDQRVQFYMRGLEHV